MKKVWSQKIWLLGALMLPLAGCGDVGTTGSAALPSTFNVGVYVADAPSTVTVTKTVTDATATAPAKTTWAVGSAGPVEFTFRSRPGSDAGSITAFRITSDLINGRETVSTPVEKTGLNIYVPSGFTCEPINPLDPSKTRTNTQSCIQTDPTTLQGNGVVTDPLLLNLVDGLSDVVIATNASVTRNTTVEFTGITARGKTFTLEATVYSRAIKTGAQ